MTRHAFIIGGTGQIGRALAAELLDHGWRVTLSSRGGRARPEELVRRGAALVMLDRDEPGALARALAGGADAVIDTVAFTPSHADQLLEVEGDAGALVVISSCSVYRDDAGRTLDEAARKGFPDFPAPLLETQSTVEPGPQTYSTRKVAVERRLLDHAGGPLTIVRPGAVHGPYSAHPREWWFVKRMLDRRSSIPLGHGGRSRFHTTAVANIAALVRAALDRGGSHILNAADPEALTVAEIGAAIASRLGYEGEIRLFDGPPQTTQSGVGRSPWSVPAPFTLSTEAAQAVGYRPAMGYRESVHAVCDWLMEEGGENWRKRFPVLASYPYELFDYAAEDRFLATGIL
ncbi:NAD-dependent epimerase/dehydratase family protein [Aureimonas populi]|uniref:NAD-dependent epimerase/dehydratase family protein n=1 Tax=Aureimonas populi TaxID=1701758 RepID=A0ABW5CMA1_9HYPH|nr:NAD-dependent epimerase/dehydratase family protein [Aureimonas populi]